MLSLGLLEEVQNRLVDKYYATYTGIVTDIQDPEKLGRIKATCPGVTGEDTELSHWMWPKSTFSGSNGNYGGLFLPLVGDIIFVSFINGNLDEPIWEHGPWGYSNNESSVPKHIRGELDEEDLGRKGVGNIPETQFSGEYGHVRMLRTPAGHLLEFDDTPNGERVQILHKTGAHIEILPDGTINEVSVGNKNQYVSGNESKQIQQNQTIQIQRNKTEIIKGNENVNVNGDGKFFYLGDVKYEVGKHEITSRGDVSNETYGSLLFTCHATEDHNIGGQHKIKVLRDEFHHILEHANWIISNSQNEAQALLFQILNGKATFLNADFTGQAIGSYLDMDQSSQSLKLFAGLTPNPSSSQSNTQTALGAGLILDGLATQAVLHALASISLEAATISLGGTTSGIALASLVAAAFAAHSHPSFGAPPDAASITSMNLCGSTKVFAG